MNKNIVYNTKKLILILFLVSTLIFQGCSLLSTSSKDGRDGAPKHPKNVSRIPNAVPKVEPKSKYGNPKSYTVRGKTYRVMKSSNGYKKKGIASWYGTKFHGKKTSSWETYDLYKMTAAHKTLPLPTYAKVKNLNNGKEVIVKINDRGPFVDNRIIDLSYAAAKKLGVYETGTAPVLVTAINPSRYRKFYAPVTKIGKIFKPKHSSKNIFLQLGAFSHKKNAKKLAGRANKIANNHPKTKVKILESVSTKGPLYKVRLGPFKSQSSALEAQEEILASNIATPTMVVN